MRSVISDVFLSLAIATLAFAHPLERSFEPIIFAGFPKIPGSAKSAPLTMVNTSSAVPPRQTVLISSDSKYSNGSASVSSLACGTQFEATGNTGTTYSSLFEFPYIAGFSNITSSDTELCGGCYVLEWAGNYVGVQVVDGAEGVLGTERFVLSEAAYAWLTLNETTSSAVVGTIVNGPFACPQPI